MVVMNELCNLRLNHEETFDECQVKRVSFVQALHEKYVEQEEFADLFSMPKDSLISTEITFVGFKEVSNVQKQLKRLASIDLSNRNIFKAGDIHTIKDCLNRVTVLNLAYNHMTWTEIIAILDCLPRLKEIILTANDLKETDDTSYPKKVFGRLESLVLGRVKLNWQTVVSQVSKIWTRIDSIDLWNNELTNGSMVIQDENPSHPFITQIRSLSLGQNQFTNLTWLLDAGQLSNMLELDLSRCMLKSLDINHKVACQLSNLRVLNISNNEIADWKEVAQLNQVKNLVSLICHDNPFFLTDKFSRARTTAHISSITTLNRETITSAFRRDAEISYLRRVFSEYEIFLKGQNDDFKLMHPRYEELVEIYGLPAGLNVKPQSVGDKFVTIELCYQNESISKKVPRDMRISNLKMLCKGLFKLRSLRGIEIICCVATPPQEGISYPLDHDGQTLHFFSVENGHRLLIKAST